MGENSSVKTTKTLRLHVQAIFKAMKEVAVRGGRIDDGTDNYYHSY